MNWTAILPYIFQFLAFILQEVNASNAVIAQFKNLIEESKNDGLISKQASDTFQKLDNDVMNQFNPGGTKNDAQNPTKPG